VGLQIVENTCIDWTRGRANGTPTRVDEDAFLPGLHDLAAAVHRAGGRIGTQLHHSGRQNKISNTVDRRGIVAPSPIACKVCEDEPAELTPAEIEALIERYVEAAVRSQRAGFDMVEVHGAHGYLIQQFVSPYTNRRADDWGGSRENRFRFALEIARGARAAVGPDFPLTYRMSAEDGVEGGLSLDDSIALATALEEAGIDALHVSTGIYESMERIFMMHGTAPGELLALAEAVKASVEIPVIGVGRLGHDPALAARAVADGRVDLVAFGRPLLAEPRLPELLKAGNFEAARPCVACNECVGALFNQWRATCVVNPEFGRERESRPRRSRDRTGTVLVAGGGPAGMEAAARLARRGLEVTLAERSDVLGGALRAAAVPGHKQPEYSRLLAFLISQVEDAGVRVLLNTTADRHLAETDRVDAVVVATGGEPLVPAITGIDLPHVAEVTALLAAQARPAGERAVVLGATQAGLDCAVWLAGMGFAVDVLEPGEEAGARINPILRSYLLDALAAAEARVHVGTAGTRIYEGSVDAEGADGTLVLDADLVVVAMGTRKRGAGHDFGSIEADVDVIGSAAVDHGTLLDATQMAMDAASQLGISPTLVKTSNT
jgi:2,4-dienoyl-CoA reductase-like NADH-dependent reductase (Old Yellow Enzyme family)/thioredoxin reductase